MQEATIFQKFPNPCLIISPPLSGKKEMVYSCVQQVLSCREPVIFITLEKSAEDIKRDLVANKIFYAKYPDILKFVDCYSLQAGNYLPDSNDTKRVPSPLALNEISIALSQIEAKFFGEYPHHTVILDSLSTILLYLNQQAVGRFVQVLIAKIKNANGQVVFTMDDGMHDEKTVVTMEHLMESIINVKKEKDKILINARGIAGLDGWTEYNPK